MPEEFLFYSLLFGIAFFYASVGHGGASGYLALMAFFSFAPETMRPTALMLNIFVSLIAFIQYYRGGYFKWKLFWPFALASIPAAFFGGLIIIDADWYKRILGILLLFPVFRLIGVNLNTEKDGKQQNFIASMFIGAVIGFFSGMIGIGGGIILSPVILLLHWANMKQTAAISALFIFVNSIAGLAGVFTTGFEYKPEIIFMISVAISGGLLGSYLRAKKFDNLFLKRLLAVVLLMASVKLMFT